MNEPKLVGMTREDAEMAEEFRTARSQDHGHFAIAYAIMKLAESIHWLGNGNAATQMGALEALGLVLKDGMAEIAQAINNNK